jgi:hypothetical protein
LGGWGPPAGPVSCCVAVCLVGVERVERGAAAVVACPLPLVEHGLVVSCVQGGVLSCVLAGDHPPVQASRANPAPQV